MCNLYTIQADLEGIGSNHSMLCCRFNMAHLFDAAEIFLLWSALKGESADQRRASPASTSLPRHDTKLLPVSDRHASVFSAR